MDSETKSKKGVKNKKTSNAKISKQVQDYGNDPFFVNKAQESKKFLDKHGFPAELVNNKK